MILRKEKKNCHKEKIIIIINATALVRLGYDPSVRRLTENDGEFSINSEKETKKARSRRRKGRDEGLREEEEGKRNMKETASI